MVVWRRGRPRSDFRGCIFPVVLRTIHAWTGRGSGESHHERFATSGDGHCGLIVCHDSLDRALSISVSTNHERFGSSACRPASLRSVGGD